VNHSDGNYGTVCTAENDLVVIDSDEPEFKQHIESNLPETFTVRTANGHHFYYKAKNWSENNRWSSPKGEIKAKNSQVAGPGSIHPTGQLYQIANDSPIQELSNSDIEGLIAAVDGVDCGEGSSGSGSGSSPPTPSPQSTTNNLDFIRRDDIRQKVAGILNDSDAGHSDRCWLAGWLYSAAGLRDSEIVSLIMDEANWGDLDRETVEKQVNGIISSTSNSRGTHYSNYTSESSSTDDAGNGDSSRGNPQTEEFANMANDNVTEYEQAKNNSAVCRAAKVEVENDGDEWEYVGLLFGEIEEDDDFGKIPNFEQNQYGDKNYKNIGSYRSPEELRLAADVLQKLADKWE
jgi:hypothetical protein